MNEVPNVSNLEKDSIVKSINGNSFVIDINTLKAPLFLYNNYVPKKNKLGEINPIEEKTYLWVDSKNQQRKLYMYCKGRLPRQFESDTLHGLMGLFVKKHAPFPFNDETKQYEINVSKLEFSWYELCEYMNIPSTGYYIEKLKEAVRILKQTQYFSYENGALYDRKNLKYLNSGEEGLSLIAKYKFKTNKKMIESDEYSIDIDSNFVIFDELIINNLRHEYFKYLNSDLFFNVLPSGIERGLYGYLEANRYDSKNKSRSYIKRSYETLRIGIPIDYTYPYEIKNRLKKPLNHLKEIGYLKDWSFGDDLKVDNKKEQCIYFCFNITAEEVKTILERKTTKTKQLLFNVTYDIEDEVAIDSVSKSERTYLKMPIKSLAEELMDRKVGSELVNEIVGKKNKWTIIKYILWADKQEYEGKITDSKGSLLSFALRRNEDLPMGSKYSDIIEFVEKEKLKAETNIESKTEKVKVLYKEYVDLAVTEFKLSEEYESIKDLILSSQNDRIEEIIKINKKLNNDVSKYEKFKVEQDKSEYFYEMLVKEVRMYKGLMSEQEFIQKKMNEN